MLTITFYSYFDRYNYYFQRIAARIGHRIKELNHLPAVMSEDMKCKAMIEYRALRLLNFQRQVSFISSTLMESLYFSNGLCPSITGTVWE